MKTAAASAMHDELMANMPEGASHNASICPFCVDKATQTDDTTSRVSDGPGETDTTEKEGGTSQMTQQTMDGAISQETHKALVDSAVRTATEATEGALATKTAEADQAAAKVTSLETELASVKSDNERLNGELDSAQVELKAAKDEVTSLKADVEARDETARLAKVASDRAEQVRNLGLHSDETIKERAEAWAKVDDADWAERVSDWTALKGAGSGDTASATKTTDTASAMTGSSETLVKEQTTDTASSGSTTSSRRAALGLA